MPVPVLEQFDGLQDRTTNDRHRDCQHDGFAEFVQEGGHGAGRILSRISGKRMWTITYHRRMNDDLLSYFSSVKQREYTKQLSVGIPQSLYDELNRVVWTSRAEGHKITKARVVEEALRTFLGLNGDSSESTEQSVDDEEGDPLKSTSSSR